MNMLFGLPFLIPIIGIILMLILKNKINTIYILQLIVSAIAVVLFTILLIVVHKNGNTVIQTANWQAPFAISLVFDGLSTFMLFIFSVVGFIICIYSITDKQAIIYYKGLFIGYWLLFLGITGAILTADIFNLYVWFEVILVGAFIVLNCTVKPFKQALLHYIILNIIGTLTILFAVIMMYSVIGSLNYAEIAIYFAHNNNSYIVYVMLIFLLFGLAIKGGLFPFYFWMPKAYPVPCVTSITILSSFITKTVMVLLIRFILLFQPLQSSYFVTIILIAGIATMVLGGIGAAIQTNIRKMLSFSTISQLGFIVVAISIHTKIAIIGAIYFIVHNVFVKTNLFLACGLVEKIYGTDDINNLGSVLKKHRIIAIIFLLSAFSLAGFPPFSGFWAKFMLIKSAVDSGFYITLAFIATASLFTLYYMLKIWGSVFCSESHILETNLHNESILLKFASYTPIYFLTIIMLFIGFFPTTITDLITSIVTNLENPSIYINSILR